MPSLLSIWSVTTQFPAMRLLYASISVLEVILIASIWRVTVKFLASIDAAFAVTTSKSETSASLPKIIIFVSQ